MAAGTLVKMVGLGTALLMTTSANAAYANLSVTTVFTTVVLDPDTGVQTPVYVHRVWANFTSPTDALYAWGGGGTLGMATINNFDFLGKGPGHRFLNNVNGGLLPPASDASVSSSDSYFTIGVRTLNQIPANQGISLVGLPGNPSDVTGTTIDLSAGGGIETSLTTTTGAPNPISLAGFTGDGDSALRILLMQLVVRAGENVGGVIGVTVNPGPLAGATTTISGQTFGIPAPGVAVLLGFGCLFGNRRRRG